MGQPCEPLDISHMDDGLRLTLLSDIMHQKLQSRKTNPSQLSSFINATSGHSVSVHGRYWQMANFISSAAGAETLSTNGPLPSLHL